MEKTRNDTKILSIGTALLLSFSFLPTANSQDDYDDYGDGSYQAEVDVDGFEFPDDEDDTPAGDKTALFMMGEGDSEGDSAEDKKDDGEPEEEPEEEEDEDPSKRADEAEGCTGPPEDRYCVYYDAPDYTTKVIEIHIETGDDLSDSAGQRTTEDQTDFYYWDDEDETWVLDTTIKDTHIFDWANKTLDANNVFTTERSNRYIHEESSNGNTTKEEHGDVSRSRQKMINGKLYTVESSDYTFEGNPPTIQDGYRSTASYDNQGRWTSYTNEEFPDGVSEEASRRDTDGDGFFDKCSIRHDDQSWEGDCPIPDDPFGDNLA